MALTYDRIATSTLTSGTNTFTFSSIPNTYTDLVAIFSCVAGTTNNPTVRYTFNGSSTGYSGAQFVGNGSTVTGNNNRNAAFISIVRALGLPATVGKTAVLILNVMNYANTSKYKAVLARCAVPDIGTESDIGVWADNSAITSMTFFSPTGNDFGVGSTFTLYGIKAA